MIRDDDEILSEIQSIDLMNKEEEYPFVEESEEVSPDAQDEYKHPALKHLPDTCKIRINGMPVSTIVRNVPKETQIDPSTTLIDCGDGWENLKDK